MLTMSNEKYVCNALVGRYVQGSRLAMSFNDYAKTWDTDERINRAKIIAQEISNSIEFGKNYSAMEFGCGTGLISFNLHDKFEGITLVDSSKGMWIYSILKSINIK